MINHHALLHTVAPTEVYAAIVYVGGASVGDSTTLSLPAGVVAGDFIIVLTYNGATATIDQPTGYTQQQTSTLGGNGSFGWSWKRTSGADSSVSGLTGIGGTGHVALVFRNVHSADPFGVAIPAIATGSGNTQDPPAVTAAYAGAIVPWAADDDDRDVTTIPSGYTAGPWINQANSCGLASAYKIIGVAGTHDPSVFQFDAARTRSWAAGTIPLRAVGT